MASFVKGGGVSTPFGRNEYMRSTRNTRFESYTLAAATIPARTIDGNANQKIVQPGTVMAKITSGAEAGKVGPFQRGAVANEVQTINLGGAVAGTITITFDGETTGAIAYNATAATVQTALEGLSNINPGDVVVTGGPLPGTITLTFGGKYLYQNVPQVTVTPTGLTGGTVTVATTTEGGAAAGGATDGRANPANIVGVCDTFLPWQTIERDVEIGVLQQGTPVQAWCLELDAAGLFVALSNATAGEAVWNGKLLGVKFA